jgi:aldehyde dehydrogenase (NAD+)
MKSLANTKLITQLFINGRFVNAKSGKTFDVYNPSTEEKIAAVQDAQVADMEDAVQAARTAFDKGPWTRMDPSARAKCLYKLADVI